MNNKAEFGVIGGSGVYQLDGVKVLSEEAIETPFGKPSDKIIVAEVSGKRVAFLPRHGVGHRLTPTEVNSRANIYALKSLGVRNVLSISAVGSLQEQFHPQDFVIPDQIIDRTRHRIDTFFGEGIVGHVGFADPFCAALSQSVFTTLQGLRLNRVHQGGTYLCMEGTPFSTRAESHLYRSWGCSIIGMTAIPEAKLAREAEMAYATIAMVTDYDCWKVEEEAVTVETVIATMKQNVAVIKKALPKIFENIPNDFRSEAHHAAKNAIMTDPKTFPATTKKNLSLLYGKYWS